MAPPLRHGKALHRDLMRLQHSAIDDGDESGGQHELAGRKDERLGKQPRLGFQKAIEFARIADGRTGNARFHPATDFASKAVAQYGLHAALADTEAKSVAGWKRALP